LLFGSHCFSMQREEEEDIYGDYVPQPQGESLREGETKTEETRGRGGEKEEEEEEEEEATSDTSSDEDDVNVVLEPSSAYYGDNSTVGGSAGGDSKSLLGGGATTRHWQRPGYSSSGDGAMMGSSAYNRGGLDLSLLPKPPADFPGANVDYSVFENEIDSLEEKPWREKGAELSDYFNYGFTEDTWREYCRRQQMMRLYSQSLMPIRTLDSGGPFHNNQPHYYHHHNNSNNNNMDSSGEPSRKVPRATQNRRYNPPPPYKSNLKLPNEATDAVDYAKPNEYNNDNDGDDVILTLTKPNVGDS